MITLCLKNFGLEFVPGLYDNKDSASRNVLSGHVFEKKHVKFSKKPHLKFDKKKALFIFVHGGNNLATDHKSALKHCISPGFVFRQRISEIPD